MDLRVPSAGTGVPGGSLAVRACFPPSRGERYPDGSPVVVVVPGGVGGSNLTNPFQLNADDLVVVNFLFPGGNDPSRPDGSDGVFDFRGAGTLQALRDVLLWASGVTGDTLGRRISELSPVPVRSDDVGLIGLSNGGNLCLAVAGVHGAELDGHLHWVVQWESPASSQATLADFGPVKYRPEFPAGGPFFNPRYLGYAPLVCPADFSDLGYQPGAIYPVFHDGNHDGVYTTVTLPDGSPSPDLNGDGVLGLDEDFPLSTLTVGGLVYHSRPVTEALAEHDVFSGNWPAALATPSQARDFWELREAVRHYENALEAIPGLEGMVLASVSDHVQTAPDRFHIHQLFDGWNANGAWVRINPAKAYTVLVDPALATLTGVPDNPANTPPADWSGADYCMPESVIGRTYQLAGVYEMADRARGTGLVPGDLTNDGALRIDDLLILEHFLAGNLVERRSPFRSTASKADLDGNGVVDGLDSRILAATLSR
ncbi:MAG: hypothetical protein KA419_13220 [Acidobacteria bacterium]|nr:hypothetical protein [Acidobacteriota bacterium]